MQILRTPADLAALCRRLRESDGKSQTELAEAIGGMSPQDVWNAESPKQRSRFSVRRRILAYYGYAVAEGYIVEPAA